MKYFYVLLVGTLGIASCKSKDNGTGAGGGKITGQAASYKAFTSDKNLNKRIATYMQLNRDLKFDALMDYLYPSIFKLATREQMSAALNSFFTTPGVQIDIDTLTVVSVDPVATFSKGKYTKFDYTIRMRMKITQPGGADPTLSDATVQRVIQRLKSSMHTDEVTFDADTRFFHINALKSAVAINDDVSKDWKFIGIENNPQIKAVVPAEVAQKYFK